MTQLDARSATNKLEELIWGNENRRQVLLGLTNGLSEREGERIFRLWIEQIRQSDRLRRCTVPSLVGTLATCLELGIEPGPTLGYAYILPYKNVATFQLGYRGIVRLLLDSGRIASVHGNAVYANDEFLLDLGNNSVEHRPRVLGPRGDFCGVYTVVVLSADPRVQTVNFWDLEQCTAFRNRFGPRDESGRICGPWGDESMWVRMALKSCLKQHAKFLPTSPRFDLAARRDSLGEIGAAVVLDDDGIVVEQDTIAGDGDDSEGLLATGSRTIDTRRRVGTATEDAGAAD